MSGIRDAFRETLTEGPLLLSGGFGTTLAHRGVPTRMPLWATAALTSDPDAVRTLHADFVRAGARVVTANTFRTDRRTLGAVGAARETRALNRRAVTLAREGVAQAAPARPVFVAGSVAPLADCYEPDAVPDDRTLTVEHGVRIGHLVAAGAPLAFVETMNTIREARIALEAAAAGDLPAVVSFVCAPGATLLSGESLADAVEAVTPLAPLAVLVTCCAVETATEAVRRLAALTTLPFGAYANGRGAPDAAHGWTFRGGVSDRAYVRAARDWLAAGASLLGGCCGTTPRTIRRLARLCAR